MTSDPCEGGRALDTHSLQIYKAIIQLDSYIDITITISTDCF